ncbi:MAG: cytochrome c biogenesis protein CcsA [Endomicrobiales bacterium]
MYLLLFDSSFVLYFLSFIFFVSIPLLKVRVGSVASIILAVAAACNFLAVIIRWNELGYPPVSNLHETLVLFAFFLAAACLTTDGLHIIKNGLAGYSSFFCLVLLGYASLQDVHIRPLMPALKSNWLVIHVVSYFLGYSACFVAFVAGVLHLAGLGKKNPDYLRQTDTLGYRAVLIAFPLMTAGLSTGAVWANTAWGRYWGWDPKETCALITWLLYATYMHMRSGSKKTAQYSAVIAVLGFASVLFTFIGAGLFFHGFHSYR